MRLFSDLDLSHSEDSLSARSCLTSIVFPFFPTVMPEFLKPESTATECCKKIQLVKFGYSATKVFCSVL